MATVRAVRGPLSGPAGRAAQEHSFRTHIQIAKDTGKLFHHLGGASWATGAWACVGWGWGAHSIGRCGFFFLELGGGSMLSRFRWPLILR
jgi:hypothetical protein